MRCCPFCLKHTDDCACQPPDTAFYPYGKSEQDGKPIVVNASVPPKDDFLVRLIREALQFLRSKLKEKK